MALPLNPKLTIKIGEQQYMIHRSSGYMLVINQNTGNNYYIKEGDLAYKYWKDGIYLALNGGYTRLI